ncbi:MAG: 3-(3-hydroxyphenyl)propionate hydroxylase, partial [Propionibacteriaceae bacterium]
LTLACELARRGVAFDLIEAAPGPQPGSRGKGLQPRTLEVFDDLGIVDRVLAHGQMAMPIRSTAPDGTVTVGGAVPDSLRDRSDIPYPASVITPEWRTEEALRGLLEELGGAVHFDTALVGFEQPGDDLLVATVREGGGRTSTITAGWLIGCDGGHSVIRKQAGIAFVGETRDEVRMVVADVAVDGLDRDAWHMWRHAEGLVTLCPLPSTDVFQYQASIAPGQDPGLGLANLQAILERRTGRADLRLLEPQWSSLWRANVRLADRYREKGVFLAGDAAHIHSPAGGQGMNTGIQDAHNLGWKLAAVVHGSPRALLDTYEAERRPVAAGVLALSDARLRQTLDQRSMPLRRDATTTQLGISYRGSLLALDDRADTAPVRAGDRAPDVTQLMTTEGERRLFDLTRGGRWTLLDYGRAPTPGPLPGVRTLRVRDLAASPDDVVDTDGQLTDAFGATGRSLVLIRPDGYVGLISDTGDAAAVSLYLATVGVSTSGEPERSRP